MVRTSRCCVTLLGVVAVASGHPGAHAHAQLRGGANPWGAVDDDLASNPWSAPTPAGPTPQTQPAKKPKLSYKSMVEHEITELMKAGKMSRKSAEAALQHPLFSNVRVTHHSPKPTPIPTWKGETANVWDTPSPTPARAHHSSVHPSVHTTPAAKLPEPTMFPTDSPTRPPTVRVMPGYPAGFLNRHNKDKLAVHGKGSVECNPARGIVTDCLMPTPSPTPEHTSAYDRDDDDDDDVSRAKKPGPSMPRIPSHGATYDPGQLEPSTHDPDPMRTPRPTPFHHRATTPLTRAPSPTLMPTPHAALNIAEYRCPAQFMPAEDAWNPGTLGGCCVLDKVVGLLEMLEATRACKAFHEALVKGTPEAEWSDVAAQSPCYAGMARTLSVDTQACCCKNYAYHNNVPCVKSRHCHKAVVEPIEKEYNVLNTEYEMCASAALGNGVSVHRKRSSCALAETELLRAVPKLVIGAKRLYNGADSTTPGITKSALGLMNMCAAANLGR